MMEKEAFRQYSSQYSKERRLNDPEWRARRNVASTKYRKEHPERALVAGARKRAVDSGLPFDLEETDIVIPEFCPVLGIPLFWGHGRGRRGCNNPNSPSIDRLIPEKGYVKGNIKIISMRANRIKYNATAEELRKVADYVESTS